MNPALFSLMSAGFFTARMAYKSKNSNADQKAPRLGGMKTLFIKMNLIIA